VDSCVTGFYEKIVGNIKTCDFCNSSCLTCVDNSFKCTKCSTLKYLSDN